MKISDGEKLIILMLSELYDKLNVKGEIDPEFLRSAIFNDQLWGVGWKYSGIPFETTETPRIVKEVTDILDMWNFVEHSYEELNEEEKATLAEKADPFRKDPKFRGFDGNNETDYMGTAMFLVNDLGRFERFKGRSFNCHHPSIDAHRRMLERFQPMRERLNFNPLSVVDLTELLNEQIPPSNRDA